MNVAEQSTTNMARHQWSVQGQVQGVGFRPFVYRTARRLGLSGFVRNDADGVTIEVQGPGEQLELFSRSLQNDKPPLAVLNTAHRTNIPCKNGPQPEEFRIIGSDSAGNGARADVTIDVAVCPDCLGDILENGDRRRGYGLTNCTNCGPRYSIVRQIPYDRPNTTMAPFAMCPECMAEYRDPGDRRFHAQPTACPTCGPKVLLVDPKGNPLPGEPYATAARLLEEDQVVAIKGIGGFHLAVRADRASAVDRLRRMKARDHKPFALMCRNLDHAGRLVHLSDEAVQLLTSPRAPIVLAGRRADAGAPIADSVAPQCDRLGVMLPYTPIHHLLFAELAPEVGSLVMTSANLSDEPLVIDNDEAVERVGGMCDALLWHERPIARCVDDSVMLDMGPCGVVPIRRARGWTPGTIDLPTSGAPAGLCVGGELKNTVAVVRDGTNQTVLSQHLGDLTHPLALAYFRRAIDDLCDLFRVEPRWIAHDMHPRYLSTEHAKRLAAEMGVPLVEVQHHHAHAAAVLAEHGRTGPALAVVCDGVGYGTDGTIWGGELLEASLTDFRRLVHLRQLQLAGGDAAALDTRRCALGVLRLALGEEFDHCPAAVELFPDGTERRMLAEMMRYDVNCAHTSGAGRYFDAAAALIGACQENRFEAQAAMRLETLARGAVAPDTGRLFYLCDNQIDLSPVVHALLEPGPQAEKAALFHEQFAQAWASAAIQWSRRTGLHTVVLSGGVFCNEILTRRVSDLLQEAGLEVLRHRLVPPGDGGIALGQAAIAAARMRGE